jgi:hypothetical protein
MSWLRDSVAARGESFGAFCGKVVVHPSWTARSMGARTLENRLRAYEKGDDASFLEQRPFLYCIFARLLDLPESEVRRLDRQHRELDLGTRIAMNDVAGASFEPSQASPLFGDSHFDPQCWQQDWWLAPSGSGRSLLGRMLRAEGKVAAVHVLTSTDQLEQVQASGAPRFIEIPDAMVAIEVAPRLAQCRGTLVAAPCPPPWEEDVHDFEPGRGGLAAAPHGTWRVFELGFDRLRVEELLDWLSRVTPDGVFLATHDEARDALLRLFDGGNFEPEAIGEVFAAYGILRQVGAALFEATLDGGGAYLRVHELVQLYFDARVALCDELDEDEPLGTWLRWLAQEQNGSEVLQALAGASLERREMVFTPVSAEQWSDSLSGHPGPDGHLGEGAGEVIRALAHAGVLQAVGHGQLALRPRWLIRAVQHRAAAKLLEQPEPLSWNWALRLPGSSLAFTVLRQESQSGRFGTVRAALELAERSERLGDTSSRARAMAAVGLAARALGVAVLLGAEPPEELAREIYRREQAWCWESPDRDLPGAQVRFPGLIGSMERPSVHRDVAAYPMVPSFVGRMDQACWLAGMLGLASYLSDAGIIARDLLLAPFSSTMATWTSAHRRRMARVADYLQLLVSSQGFEAGELDLAVRRLVYELVGRVGHCAFVLASGRPAERPFVHPLFWTTYFLVLVQHGSPCPADKLLRLLALDDVDLYPPLDTVFSEAEQLGCVPSSIVPLLLRLWRSEHPEHLPSMLELRLLRGELEFVEHLTLEDIDGPLGDALLRADKLDTRVHAALDADQWTVVIEHSIALDVPADWSEICERLPVAVLPVLLRRGLLSTCGLAGGRVLWRRFPFDLVHWCQQEIGAGKALEGLLSVLAVAPPARLAQLAPAIGERISVMGPLHPSLPILTRIVLTAADQRPDGWLELQALLMALIELGGRGARAVSDSLAVSRGSSVLPSPLPLGRVVGAEPGREIPVVLARPGTEDRGVIIAASETGFSPLGARLREESPVGEEHALIPLVEAMRASELGPLVCSVPWIPRLGTKPLVIVQTDRGPWFENAFPGGLRPWSAELTEHYQRIFLASLTLAGRLQLQEPVVTVAHPVGHGWPLGLVDAVVAGLGEAASGDGWIPDEVLIDGCCVARDGAAFVRALDQAETCQPRTAFELEPVAWAALGIDIPKDLAVVELFRVKES